MKTKFLGLLSWKQSGSSSFSFNKFNSQANKDWRHNSYIRSHWMVLKRVAAVCTHTSKCLPVCGGSWAYNAQPFPEELKKWPWAVVVCAGAGDKDSINLFGQMYTGMLQDRLLFIWILCWLDSKFKFINLGRLWLLLWMRETSRAVLFIGTNLVCAYKAG